MSLVVRKSSAVVVRPSPEPGTTRGTIKLSSFDQGLYKVPNTSLLLFEHPIHNAAETIQGALARALTHYYPIAGRIIVAGATGDDDEDVHVECNDEGVEFVAASTHHTLKEVVCFDRSPGARKLLDELAVYYPAMTCGPGDPLLLMQVTEFSCGGFVLGATWNHAVADGAGMGQFLRAVGELAGGLPSPSVAPVRWDDSLPGLPPSVLEAQQHMLGLDPLNDLASMDITIPLELINRIRADFSSIFHGQPCTTFEVVLAVLWQCRARAIRLDPEAPILLVFLADVRKHVGAKDGYYGNCILEQLAMAKSGAVADRDVKDVIMVIKHAKDQVPDRLKKDEEGITSCRSKTMIGRQELCKLRAYDTMTVASWRNIGFDRVDFGSGRPVRVTSSGKDLPPSPGAIGLLCNETGGVSVLSALVREEHADAFLEELAKFIM
ncbi:Methanol O-anthraniloyltransferase [Dichanthelium oligosanthes]|uniref:Methanol O-anthraniloyltransferase n=1 Tax=Dichanthelium oligosanthes TaxID=888268 RepID=A0A1E5UVF2_9POAL|nr:Methanol O-anthraniloyltransferase [Dichanthelium oligosanthes]